MAIAVRELSGDINTFQILFFRSLIGLAVITSIIIASKQTHLFKSQRIRQHGLRNAFHFAGQYGWFVGIALLPLAQVFALEFTTPLWTMLIAAWLLKEKITLKKTAAMTLGLMGVYIIVSPGSEIFNAISLVVLAAAFCYAMAHINTKSLSQSEHPLTILFYMCAIQLPIAGLLTFNNWYMPNIINWGWLFIVGITALSAHYCIAKAMLYSDVSTVVTLDFLRLPLIAILGMALYSEAFNFAVIIGALLMLLGNLLNTHQIKLKTTPS
jgi:drug/metabolite transporter (DMT)-like permease